MILKPNRFLERIILMGLLFFFLSGCLPIISIDSEMQIGMNEAWNFSTTLVVDPAMADATVLGIQQQYIGTAQQLGITTNVTKLPVDQAGHVPVKLTAVGRGYGSLNRFLGQDVITVTNTSGKRILNFHFVVPANFLAQSTNFTLHGGKILGYNGEFVNDTTVRWINFYAVMTAQMEEPSWIDYLFWAIVALGAVGATAGLVFLINSLKPRSSNKARYPIPGVPTLTGGYTANKLCRKCKKPIPVQSVFCPRCGTRRP